ncbi:hypothetical protein BDN72DRAFT_895570 [Pluteus cervinus]|uniref:Uncharacterized protein n=1 Tax=Pluteus cervinus TaxID=181527 RepID=A0ACD3B1D8_9AGAR|nr:hypothetical protein BDN72DRAFT_895570 [Pluteus cervinus]
MAELQPELVDLVIKHITTADNPLDEVTSTLLNSCLVSHTWRTIAQPMLFAEVPRRSPAKGLARFSDRLFGTLSRYEYLKGYITSLAVDVGDLAHLSRKRLFDLIPQIHELVLVTRSSSSLNTDTGLVEMWANINPSTRLTTICVTTVNKFPIDIFYYAAALKRLHLIDVGFIGFSSTDGSPISNLSAQTQRAKLSDLYLFSQLDKQDIRILSWFLHPQCAFDFSELSTCHIIYTPFPPDTQPKPESHLLIERFLQSLNTPVIRDIGFCPPRTLLKEEADFPRYQIFHNLPSLQSVKVALDEAVQSDQSLIQWVVSQFLPQLSHPERLEELLIPLSFGHDTSYNTSKASLGWDSLDTLLSSDFGPFLNLRRVHVAIHDPTRVTYPQDHLEMMQALKHTITQLLPQLHERNILRVTLSPCK